MSWGAVRYQRRYVRSVCKHESREIIARGLSEIETETMYLAFRSPSGSSINSQLFLFASLVETKGTEVKTHSLEVRVLQTPFSMKFLLRPG